MTTIVPPSSSAAAAAAAGPGSTKKSSIPGQPWSHLETTALIDAYESKWYSLNRGQLKAQQWEEVAATVTARCSDSGPNNNIPPPKTGTQCRHKIEKLRKRYRSEKNRPFPSLWPYYDRMERMERGPLPVSIKAPVTTTVVDSDASDSNDEEEEDEFSEDAGGSGTCNGAGVLMVEMAREVMRFGEAMVRVEKRRMEMMREVERDWLETEEKRAEMVEEAHRGILESIAGAFTATKKTKTAGDL